MENSSKPIRRRLPPELLAEIHKCLPLADVINVLVNVPTRAIYQNNSPRMRRTIQRIKTFLNEYIETFDLEEPRMFVYHYDDEEEKQIEEENDRTDLRIFNDFDWKTQFDALLCYGAAMTSIKSLYTDAEARIVGIPENFVEKLLLDFGNSSSPQMMLPFVYLKFEKAIFPTFLKEIFNKKEYRIGIRYFFESVELKTEDGRILRIHNGEMYDTKCKDEDATNELKFVVVNKMYWFQILLIIDHSKKFVKWIEFTRWKMQPLDDDGNFENTLGWFENGEFRQFGNHQLEAEGNINWNLNWDRFLRYGVHFTRFRHLKIKQHYCFRVPNDYACFLISFIGNTKLPDAFLETIDINLAFDCSSSIYKLWKFCRKGIPEDGKIIKFNKKKLHILSAKTTKMKRKWMEDLSDGSTIFGYNELEFTLANMATNGLYVFDVELQFGKRAYQILGIKIQKRKLEN